MRCPGQDRRYWTEDAVFEVPCPECGSAVEFFKDETSGRCSRCGHRFANPGLDFGCAQWCALAQQCLGLVPDVATGAEATPGALAGRLIQRVSEVFEANPARLIRSLKVYHFAKQLVAAERGHPRIVLAAALLLDFTADSSNGSTPVAAATTQQAREILADAGVDPDTIARVCEIIEGCRSDRDHDCVEFRIVRDADALATLSAEVLTHAPHELTALIESRLTTEAAKEWARKWVAGRAPDSDTERG